MISLKPSADAGMQQSLDAFQDPKSAPGSESSPPSPSVEADDQEEAGADPEPSTAPVDPDGDTDPGASNTGDVHPL